MSTPIIPVRPEAKDWHVIDASTMPLGRLASRVADILRGKHKPEFSPHQDHGDHVVVINAASVQLTGKKQKNKTYFRHTGWMGGAKFESIERLQKRAPEEVIRRAVRGMLPKNRLGRAVFRKLQVYKGSKHPHAAQKPQPLTFD